MRILRDFLLYRLFCQITTHLASERAEGRRVSRTPTLPHIAGAGRTGLNKKGGRAGSDLSLQTQQIPHQRAHAEAGTTFGNVRTILLREGRASDVEVSPGQTTDEFFKKEGRGDRAGIATADVLDVRHRTADVFLVLFDQWQPPERLTALLTAT